MYYHIIAEKKPEVKGEKTRILYKYDMSEADVLKFILLPKTKGTNFLLNGYTLNEGNIERLEVVSSEKTISEVIEDIRASYRRSGMACFLTEETVVENPEYVHDVTDELMEKCSFSSQFSSPKASIETKKVFIVHGHDNEKVIEVENFIRRIGYDPVVLFEQASKGKTIIEKFEENASQVCFAVVLYSPCDFGYEIGKESDGKVRARQNVLFEHGYLMGKLGRSRVCALLTSGDIETPSDISGVIYILMEDQGWEIDIVKNMKSVWLNVDMNLL